MVAGYAARTMLLHEVVDRDDRHLGWTFRCPGCSTDPHNSGIHAIYDAPNTHGYPVWTFDGNQDRPTFSPSLLTHVYGRDDPRKCHLFVRSGVLEFCSDSYHPLAGKTVPMVDWDEDPWR